MFVDPKSLKPAEAKASGTGTKSVRLKGEAYLTSKIIKQIAKLLRALKGGYGGGCCKF